MPTSLAAHRPAQPVDLKTKVVASDSRHRDSAEAGPRSARDSSTNSVREDEVAIVADRRDTIVLRPTGRDLQTGPARWHRLPFRVSAMVSASRRSHVRPTPRPAAWRRGRRQEADDAGIDPSSRSSSPLAPRNRATGSFVGRQREEPPVRRRQQQLCRSSARERQKGQAVAASLNCRLGRGEIDMPHRANPPRCGWDDGDRPASIIASSGMSRVGAASSISVRRAPSGLQTISGRGSCPDPSSSASVAAARAEHWVSYSRSLSSLSRSPQIRTPPAAAESAAAC
ncbi:unnamed protein product [Acanthosepion pharaonis]|uniref:Uncharacterized protein n=1 Tax=Acanthosepion pharaonis TaxID=158019 RepID=A0A812DRA4_ACAPH|nr:unnamed protein product [Sepia pharaonis]